jgi:hypothetical protein
VFWRYLYGEICQGRIKMNNAAMNGEEIAEALGITRQAVSNSLKRGMRKCYLYVRRTWPELSPLSASIFLMKWLDSIGSIEFDMNEIKKFTSLFPPDIRKEINQDIESKRDKSYMTILEQVNSVFDLVGV